MSHVRNQIRNRIATLVTGLPVTGANVYKMRKYALDDSKLPAICVYTTDESSSLITVGTRTLRRVINVMVEVLAKGSSVTISDTIDNICISVEEAIAADFSLNGLAKSTILTSTETDVNIEGENGIGSARLVYAVEYVTSIDDVETAR
jgi:predicted regulator of amino acid metabolism with ACT domain